MERGKYGRTRRFPLYSTGLRPPSRAAAQKGNSFQQKFSTGLHTQWQLLISHSNLHKTQSRRIRTEVRQAILRLFPDVKWISLSI